MQDDDRLQRLLGGEVLSSLRKRLRQRFERGPADGKLESLRLANLDADEHAALAGLIGRNVRFTSSMQIDVPLIDAALSRAGIAGSLREALELIDGPIVHAETARAELHAQWSKAVSVASHADLLAFLQAPSGLGLLKRLSNGNPDAAGQLCYRANVVLNALPAGGMTRAQLAATILGDAHALDNGRPVAALVLAVWREKPAPKQHDEDAFGVENDIGDERIRDVWARAGVLVNELARPALLLNLNVKGRSTQLVASGEPTYASLRFLLRSNPSWDVEGRDVYVCENANLLAAAADRHGANCAAMMCTDGMPAAAQRVMLQQLADAGALLRYHGDFDWAGVRIGNYVMRECGAQPWRFDAANYIAAVAQAPRPGLALTGPEAKAVWDEALRVAMREHQLSIAEESLTESLLQDLA
ncbi:TIGR02679 family protein [Bradyrhizobium sp. JR3.5]